MMKIKETSIDSFGIVTEVDDNRLNLFSTWVLHKNKQMRVAVSTSHPDALIAHQKWEDNAKVFLMLKKFELTE